MRVALVFLAAAALEAQTALPSLHVSPHGAVLDASNNVVLLRGVNRSGTGSGNADAAATDAQYAAQNQLLSMNLVRIFVNTAWWTGNVQVPIANLAYQDYLDQLIQRAKKYGNYVLIVKAGQFPDAPCGADGKNCPAPNQGDLNCQANASACPAQDTSGTYVTPALQFWGAFAKKYAADPAILYDTWEDMRGLDPNTWSDNENQLITTIRSYSPASLIFMEDTGSAFESIAAGNTPDPGFANIVWNFHLYQGSAGACAQTASPRYANWSQNMDSLVNFAQQNGHAVAFTEWGGCNDSEPYHTNITSYAKTHGIALVYFDSSNLFTVSGNTLQLTSTGTKVAQAYSSITPSPTPSITLVANAFGDTPLIAPNTWVEIKGTNLAQGGDSRIWLDADFFGGQMPDQIDGVSVKVNGIPAYVYFVSGTQVNILTPPQAIQGPVQVQLTNSGVPSNTASVPSQALSPSFFVFVSNGTQFVYGRHLDGSLIGPPNMLQGVTSTPVKPGELIVLAGNGFGATSAPVIPGSSLQSGTLATLPVITIGGVNATVQFAGLVSPGDYQFNVVVPSTLTDGNKAIVATYNGAQTQSGATITIQH